MSLLQSSWTASCLCYTEVLDESCHSPNRFQSTLKHILHTSKLQKSPLRMDLVLLCTHRIGQAQTDLPSLCIPAKTKECKRGRTLHRSSSSAGYMRCWSNTSFTRRRRSRNKVGKRKSRTAEEEEEEEETHRDHALLLCRNPQDAMMMMIL